MNSPIVQYGPVNQDKYEECSNKQMDVKENYSNQERCGSEPSSISALRSDIAVEDIDSSDMSCNLLTYLDSARVSPLHRNKQRKV